MRVNALLRALLSALPPSPCYAFLSRESSTARCSVATKEMMKDEFKKAVGSLNLSRDQKTKLHGILNDAKTQRESIFKDSGLTDGQKHGKLGCKARTIQ